MSTKTENERLMLLEGLLADARSEADYLRKKLAQYKQVIASTRMIMGHEVKKPAIALSGYLELICDDLEQANHLRTLTLAEKAQRECALLTELNGFYLDLLRVDSEEDVVGQVEVNVGKLIRSVVDGLPMKFNAQDRVVVNVEEDAPWVSFNRNALRLIIMNLIENALLYSQVSTPIRVDVEGSKDRRGMEDDRRLLKIVVSDKGIGIPREYLGKIFNPFIRLREDIAEGSGLGLTLVRSLVELNGGEVFIRSEQGGGTAVHVTIPTRRERDEGSVIHL